MLIVGFDSTLQFRQFSCQLLVRPEHFPQLHEGAYDINTDLNRSRSIEDAGHHHGSVLGKGIGQSWGKLEGLEVVAICDHLGFLLVRQLKHEIGGKAVPVAIHLLVQAPGAYPVEPGEVGIQHYFLTANQQDAGFKARELENADSKFKNRTSPEPEVKRAGRPDAAAGAMPIPTIPFPKRKLRYTEHMATIDIANLSIEERLRLLDELWESLSRTAEAIPLTSAQRTELDRRLDEVEREGPAGIPWEDVLRRIRAAPCDRIAPPPRRGGGC